MKRTIRILVAAATLAALSGSATSSAQTADLRLTSVINPGAGTGDVDQLAVSVEVDTDVDFKLGTSAFRFFYNSDALDIPSGVSAGGQNLADGTDYAFTSPFVNNPGGGQFYTSNTVTTQGQLDRLSANLVLAIAGLGQTVSAAAGWVSIATIYFDISDNQQTEGLEWVATRFPGDTNPSIVLKDDNTTGVAIGTRTGSDMPLDGGLAVELAGFSSVVNEDAVTLSWTTASESDNAGFAVEVASTGSATWTEVGFVRSVGESNSPRTYSYDVTDLDYGTYRMRLKHVNVDGSFDYSPEIEVSIELGRAFELGAVYPSPFSNSANFTLAVREAQPVSVEVFNLLGQKVQTVFDGDLAANQTRAFTIDGARLSNGVYLVRARGASFATTTSVTVVK